MNQGNLYDITANKHGGNPESVKAHESTSPEEREQQRMRVLAIVGSFNEHGRTTDEISYQTGMLHQSVSARMTELKALAHIVKTDRKRLTRAGCGAAVCVITQAGRMALKLHGVK